MKHCKDCKHFRPEGAFWRFFNGYRFARCAKAADVVTGRPQGFCDIERLSEMRCGMEARNFEPKDGNG